MPDKRLGSSKACAAGGQRRRRSDDLRINAPSLLMSKFPSDQADQTMQADFRLAPVFSPHGRLTLVEVDDAPLLEAAAAERLQAAFARGSGHGLLQLGASEVSTALPAVLSYWRDFAARYVTALCTLPDIEDSGAELQIAPPSDDVLLSIADAAPPMAGAEYVSAAALGDRKSVV